MGGRAVSPGGALLRSSRMFSIPKPLPEPPATAIHVSKHRSDTMTKNYPQHQSITSPLSSREKGDWGFKRPLPIKTTMATSTPFIRVKQVDSVESITDFNSAADHSLSLEKFQEMHIAMSIPRSENYTFGSVSKNDRHENRIKSVFEEDMDFTVSEDGTVDEKRWKFKGPWLAKMTEGEFLAYVDKHVRPKRAEFRVLLKEQLANSLTAKQNAEALEKGVPVPPRVMPRDIKQGQFTEYLHSLRNDRVTLYALVSKFLDLAPLGQPVGIAQAGIFFKDKAAMSQSPYGKSGPPPSHPSAGISYLRTNSFMDNHPVYGPQARHSPIHARIISPRQGPTPARLGVGGFVANVPVGDNEFNFRHMRNREGKGLQGIQNLDISTFGGAKAYVDAHTASVNPEGKVVLELREASAESQVVAKESKGESNIYQNSSKKSKGINQSQDASSVAGYRRQQGRMDQVMDEVVAEDISEKDIMSSSNSYGLGSSEGPESRR